jgi:hypothetical protein
MMNTVMLIASWMYIHLRALAERAASGADGAGAGTWGFASAAGAVRNLSPG